MLATGGGGKGGEEKNFPVVPCRNCTFLTTFFLKTWKFPNTKGTFDVNLVLTATLACTKRAIFITKKGTFHHKKGHFSSQKRALLVPPCHPRFLRPCFGLYNKHTCRVGESGIGRTSGGWKFPELTERSEVSSPETSSHPRCVQSRTHRTCKYVWFLSHAISVKY